MSHDEFYTDRVGPTVARDQVEVSNILWRGVVALADGKIHANWFAHQFPQQCQDGQGIFGTDVPSLIDSMNAYIPGLDWPPSRVDTPTTGLVLDLVDFLAARAAKPVNDRYHSFFGHHELNFDTNRGRAEFRAEINSLFARNGLAFEIGPDNYVVRLGPAESRPVVGDLRPQSGDVILDQMVTEARVRFTSRNPADVRIALEKLWDSFERLKTLGAGSSKKQKVENLLASVADEPMRSFLNDEAIALTKIGNTMHIRHSETDQSLLSASEVDYVFVRMSALLVHLLRVTGMLG